MEHCVHSQYMHLVCGCRSSSARMPPITTIIHMWNIYCIHEGIRRRTHSIAISQFIIYYRFWYVLWELKLNCTCTLGRFSIKGIVWQKTRRINPGWIGIGKRNSDGNIMIWYCCWWVTFLCLPMLRTLHKIYEPQIMAVAKCEIVAIATTTMCMSKREHTTRSLSLTLSLSLYLELIGN